jgi:hypothetical protein
MPRGPHNVRDAVNHMQRALARLSNEEAASGSSMRPTGCASSAERRPAARRVAHSSRALGEGLKAKQPYAQHRPQPSGARGRPSGEPNQQC